MLETPQNLTARAAALQAQIDSLASDEDKAKIGVALKALAEAEGPVARQLERDRKAAEARRQAEHKAQVGKLMSEHEATFKRGVEAPRAKIAAGIERLVALGIEAQELINALEQADREAATGARELAALAEQLRALGVEVPEADVSYTRAAAARIIVGRRIHQAAPPGRFAVPEWLTRRV